MRPVEAGQPIDRFQVGLIPWGDEEIEGLITTDAQLVKAAYTMCREYMLDLINPGAGRISFRFSKVEYTRADASDYRVGYLRYFKATGKTAFTKLPTILTPGVEYEFLITGAPFGKDTEELNELEAEALKDIGWAQTAKEAIWGIALYELW